MTIATLIGVEMKLAALIAGAVILGFVFPEFTTQWGTKANAPLLQNILAATAFGLLAYGLSA